MPYDIEEKHTHPKHPRLVLLLTTGRQNFLARTYLRGKLRYKSTGSPSLTTSLRLAGEWYGQLLRASESAKTPPKHSDVITTIGDAFEHYAARLKKPSAKVSTKANWSVCREFWAPQQIADVSSKMFKEFYVRRRAKGIGNHTLHKNVTLVRQVLKHCAEEEFIEKLPFIPRVGKIKHNPRKWFTREEWQTLQGVSRQRIKDAPNIRTKGQRQDCHDFMVFMTHSMMRVDEVRHLTFADCRETKNKAGEDILLVNVRISKTGPRPNVVCMPGAASVYRRRRTPDKKPTDRLFPHRVRDAFRELLRAASLYEDGDGNRRNLKSLRATGISFRILAGANLMLVAKNSGTSVLSIQNFYAKYLRPDEDVDELTKMP